MSVDVVLLLKAAIMGVVEGLTEFLPISSTGHLILAGSLLNFADAKAKVFDIAIQTGAIFAVILVFWPRLHSAVVNLPTSRRARRFFVNVGIAFVPAVVLGLLTLVSLVAGGLITWRYRRQGPVPSGASARLRDDRPSVLTSEQWSELPVSSVMDLDATADDSPLLASDPGPPRRRRVRYKRHRLPNL